MLLTVPSDLSRTWAMRCTTVILPLLGGCVFVPGSLGPALEPVDLAPAAQAFELALPHQALALLDDPALWLPGDADCPVVSVGPDGLERWQGGCALADGAMVFGSLERFVGPERAWVAGERLQVVDATGSTLLYLDGAVEQELAGELVSIGASFTACGIERPCARGPATVDLALSLFPISGYPVHYDLAVEGVVAAADLEPTSVGGTVSIDLHACAVEPASGSLLLDGDAPWGLDFDGASACDACAATAFDGLPLGLGCEDWL